MSMSLKAVSERGLLIPDWPAPPSVRALVTTRTMAGASTAPYDPFNLATHVGDDPGAVATNRSRLRSLLPGEPCWLEQVHGTAVADADAALTTPVADAALARGAGAVCAILTADCLPVLFCDDTGDVVAAAHAGWRGLAAGVLETTVARMGVPPSSVLAWLGPAIGPQAFEVGGEVRDAFLRVDPDAGVAFVSAAEPGKWMADLFTLARRRLMRAGVARVYGGGVCTYADASRYYSYRRDGVTGRFASLIWREGR